MPTSRSRTPGLPLVLICPSSAAVVQSGTGALTAAVNFGNSREKFEPINPKNEAADLERDRRRGIRD